MSFGLGQRQKALPVIISRSNGVADFAIVTSGYDVAGPALVIPGGDLVHWYSMLFGVME